MLVPVSALNSFDTIAIILLVPLADQLVYPYIKNHTSVNLTMLRKIACGFVCALSAMLIAAIVERVRVQYAPEAGNYYDVQARENISPCQSIDDYNPYRYQVSLFVCLS